MIRRANICFEKFVESTLASDMRMGMKKNEVQFFATDILESRNTLFSINGACGVLVGRKVWSGL